MKELLEDLGQDIWGITKNNALLIVVFAVVIVGLIACLVWIKSAPKDSTLVRIEPTKQEEETMADVEMPVLATKPEPVEKQEPEAGKEEVGEALTAIDIPTGNADVDKLLKVAKQIKKKGPMSEGFIKAVGEMETPEGMKPTDVYYEAASLSPLTDSNRPPAPENYGTVEVKVEDKMFYFYIRTQAEKDYFGYILYDEPSQGGLVKPIQAKMELEDFLIKQIESYQEDHPDKDVRQFDLNCWIFGFQFLLERENMPGSSYNYEQPDTYQKKLKALLYYLANTASGYFTDKFKVGDVRVQCVEVQPLKEKEDGKPGQLKFFLKIEHLTGLTQSQYVVECLMNSFTDIEKVAVDLEKSKIKGIIGTWEAESLNTFMDHCYWFPNSGKQHKAVIVVGR